MQKHDDAYTHKLYYFLFKRIQSLFTQFNKNDLVPLKHLGVADPLQCALVRPAAWDRIAPLLKTCIAS